MLSNPLPLFSNSFFVRAIYGCALAVPGGVASYFCSWVTRKSWYFSLKSYAGCPGSCRFRAIFRKAQPWLLAWSKGVMRYVYIQWGCDLWWIMTSPQAESLINGLFIFVLVRKKCSKNLLFTLFGDISGINKALDFLTISFAIHVALTGGHECQYYY